MASEVKTNKVSPSTGTTLSVGDSGDTLALATDAVTGFQVGSDAAGDVLYHDGTDYTRLAKPGTPADEVLTFATSATAPSWVAAAGGLFSAFAVIVDEKTGGTSGGTFTSGDWRTRDLQTKVTDEETIVTISGNEFTLTTGNYFINWSAPAMWVNGHKTRLYDVTGTAEVELGTTEYCAAVPAGYPATINKIMNRSSGFARVAIAGASNVYRIEHHCETTNSGNGFGISVNYGAEIYTTVEIYKEA